MMTAHSLLHKGNPAATGASDVQRAATKAHIEHSSIVRRRSCPGHSEKQLFSFTHEHVCVDHFKYLCLIGRLPPILSIFYFFLGYTIVKHRF